MADRTRLGYLGFFFSSVTVAVAAIAFLVVANSVNAGAASEDVAMAAQFIPVSTR